MKSQEFTVWDSTQEPIPEAEVIYRWNGYTEGDFVYSLLRYVDNHGEKIRSKYLSFIYELGEKYIKGKRITEHLKVDDDCSLWWMSLLVEKSPFKSPRIIDCLRLLALEEILLEKKPSAIKLVSSNKDLAEAVRIICENYGVMFQWDIIKSANKKLTVKYLYRKLPTILQALIYIFYYFISRTLLRKNGLPSWHHGSKSVFFLSYFFNLETKLTSKGEFYSRQWGGLPEFLHANGLKSNYVHHYLYSPDIPNTHIATNLIRQFNDSDKQDVHVIIDSFLSWRLIFVVFYKWLKLSLVSFFNLRKVYKHFFPQNSKVSLWPLLQKDWKASTYGPAVIQNLLWLELFNVILKSIPYQQIGFYLCENQGWERAFISKWRKYNHGKLIAVPHSTIRYWDLRYYYDRRTLNAIKSNPMLFPDKYALNGMMAWRAFVSSGFKSNQLIKVEALRYQYLYSKNYIYPDNIIREHTRKVSRNIKNTKDVLVLGDFTKSQTNKMLDTLREAKGLLNGNISFIFKPHPLCKFDLSAYSSLSLKITNKQLTDILEDIDTVFSSNTTSAGLDAYLKGVPAVVFMDDETLNFSPLRGVADVDFVSNSIELAIALQVRKQKMKVDIDEFFWLDPSLSKWKKIFKTDEVML